MAFLEHVNITVKDPKHTAKILQNIFDWHIRWEGASLDNGYSVHVGSDQSYVALYAPAEGKMQGISTRYTFLGSVNHIGIVVEDLQAIETKVKAAGFEPHNHADYEPGQRFYFDGPDGVEYEVVQYD